MRELKKHVGVHELFTGGQFLREWKKSWVYPGLIFAIEILLVWLAVGLVLDGVVGAGHGLLVFGAMAVLFFLTVVVYAAGVVRDAAERKRVEDSIVRQGEFLVNTIEALGQPFYVINADDSSVQLANSAACDGGEYDGCTRCCELSEARGEPCKATGQPCPVEEVKRTRGHAVVEHVYEDAGAGKRYVEVHGHPIFGDSGEIEQVIEYRLDVTERRHAEMEREKLYKALEAKNKELESIVYVTSHDLRSPLVNIQGFSSELAASCAEAAGLFAGVEMDADVREKLERILVEDVGEASKFINAGVNKMEGLIKGLLTLSRIGQANIRVDQLDMNEVVSASIDSMQYRIRDLKIDILIDKLPGCIGDVGQISQVFGNLIDNAVKYLDAGRDGCIRVTGQTQNGSSIYCVEDNGVGIAENHQANVFKLFHRLEPDGGVAGDGIGLTTVRRILERHGGKVWVDSAAGSGARFYVELPRH